jgi:hypothetical protein
LDSQEISFDTFIAQQEAAWWDDPRRPAR